MDRLGKLIMVIGLAVIGLAIAVFATGFETGNEGDSPVVGAPTPELTLPYLEGDGTVSLKALDEAYEVVVINFFASWCIQCRNEHADLIATADAYHDRSVQFLGITFQDRPGRSADFLDELGWGATTQYLTDPGALAAIEFGIIGVPETVFIKDGVIVGKLLGESDALTLSNTLERILSGEDVGYRQVGEFRSSPDS